MDPNKLKSAPVRPENVVAYRSEDGSLSDLVPNLQVPKPTELVEVANQVYETVLHEEVQNLLTPWSPLFIEVHVQVPKDNGVPEALQGLLQVSQMLQR